METKDISFWLRVDCDTAMSYDGININRTSDSITPLTLYILEDNQSMINLLLDLGCDTRESDDMAFCASVIYGNYKLVEKLLQMGANVNAIPNQLIINYLVKYPGLLNLKYNFDYDMLQIRTSTIEIIKPLNGMLCYVVCRCGSDDNYQYQMLKLLLDYNIDSTCHRGFTTFTALMRTTHLDVNIFKEILTAQSIHFTFKQIVELFYCMMIRHPEENIIFPLLEELLLKSPEAIEFLLSEVFSIFIGGHHLSLRTLNYCLKNLDCQMHLDQFDKVYEQLSLLHHKDNYQLIDLMEKYNVRIKKHVTKFYIQAVYYQDINLLNTISKYVDRDLILDELRHDIKTRLKS